MFPCSKVSWSQDWCGLSSKVLDLETEYLLLSKSKQAPCSIKSKSKINVVHILQLLINHIILQTLVIKRTLLFGAMLLGACCLPDTQLHLFTTSLVTQAVWEEKNGLVSTVCACVIIPKKPVNSFMLRTVKPQPYWETLLRRDLISH